MQVNSYTTTQFIDSKGNLLGEATGILPISLYKGMNITIHGNDKKYCVVAWSYHQGHPDEGAGLKIELE